LAGSGQKSTQIELICGWPGAGACFSIISGDGLALKASDFRFGLPSLSQKCRLKSSSEISYSCSESSYPCG
jgi:hypothetical protein